MRYDRQEAVDASCFHHQRLPEEISFEPQVFDKAFWKSFRKKATMDVNVNQELIKKVDAIFKLPTGEVEGGADPRGDNTAAGFYHSVTTES